MPALLGYLLTLVVFLSGGYAGMQWLTEPDSLPSAVAVQRSIQPVKSTRARVLARRRHEAAAERQANTVSAATPLASDETSPQSAEPAPSTALAKSEPANEPDRPTQAGQPAVAERTIDKPKAASSVAVPEKAEVSLVTPAPAGVTPAARTAAIAGGKAAAIAEVSAQADAAPDRGAIATGSLALGGSVTNRNAETTTPVKKTARSDSARDENQPLAGKRVTVAKRRATTRLASRKPVMMILRTIEFPDGRREQRLLSMPRYRQAFADD